MKKHTIYGPGVIFVSVLHVNGTISHRHENRLVTSVGSPTETKSDWSEFIFRLVPCITKRMKRNVWRPTRTHAGLRLSLSLVNTR